MKKLLLIITIFFSISFAAGAAESQAISAFGVVQPSKEGPRISLAGGVLRVTGGAGQVLQIYNVAGVLVRSERLSSDDCRLELSLPRGCYIVKVGKTVRKVALQ